MPKLSPLTMKSVFYLYHSRDDAIAGTKFGGTGFFLSIEQDGHRFCYAVSNWHVAVQGGASVIRVNTLNSGTDIFEFEPHDWHFIPGGHDLAVAATPLDATKHDFSYINSRMIAFDRHIEQAGIGPGDDVFMVGRFIDHDGGQTNVPAARFGNISVMPQPIEQPTGAKHLKSYVLDVHSRTGYSGSPVFVYRTDGSDLTGFAVRTTHQFVMLLGVLWGQFPERWEIAFDPTIQDQIVRLKANANFVKGMSGMTLAIPATAILELLETPKLKEQRREIFESLKQKASGKN